MRISRGCRLPARLGAVDLGGLLGAVFELGPKIVLGATSPNLISSGGGCGLGKVRQVQTRTSFIHCATAVCWFLRQDANIATTSH